MVEPVLRPGLARHLRHQPRLLLPRPRQGQAGACPPLALLGEAALCPLRQPGHHDGLAQAELRGGQEVPHLWTLHSGEPSIPPALQPHPPGRPPHGEGAGAPGGSQCPDGGRQQTGDGRPSGHSHPLLQISWAPIMWAQAAVRRAREDKLIIDFKFFDTLTT